MFNINKIDNEKTNDALDAEFETIIEEKSKSTGAKKCAKVIGVLLLCTALATGLTSKYIRVKQINNIKEDLSIALENLETKKTGFIQTNTGEEYALEEINVEEILSEYTTFKYKNKYYSKVDEELYSVTVSIENVYETTTTITPVEYLFTEEEYNNQDIKELASEKGTYKMHAFKKVKAKPIEELYELLDVEYKETNKLNK
jgi:hypothetical protein